LEEAAKIKHAAFQREQNDYIALLQPKSQES
jgi:hypothetical protein